MSGGGWPNGAFNYNFFSDSSPSEGEETEPLLHIIQTDAERAATNRTPNNGREQIEKPRPTDMPAHVQPTIRTLERIRFHIDQHPRVGRVDECRGVPRRDQKPMDPPCIARITIVKDADSNEDFNIDNPNLFCHATLELAPGEQPYEQDTSIYPVHSRLVGNSAASVHCAAESPGGLYKCYFIWRDLTVQECGIYRLRLTLFYNMEASGGFDFYAISTAYTEPFEIYPRSTFPGYQKSSELTDRLSGMGTKLTKRLDSKKVALTKQNEAIARRFAANRKQQGIDEDDFIVQPDGSLVEFHVAHAVGSTPMQAFQPAVNQPAARKGRGRPRKAAAKQKQEEVATTSAATVATAHQQPNDDLSQSPVDSNTFTTDDASISPNNADFTNALSTAFTSNMDFPNATAFTYGTAEGFIPDPTFYNVMSSGSMASNAMVSNPMVSSPIVDDHMAIDPLINRGFVSNFPTHYPHLTPDSHMQQNMQPAQPVQRILSPTESAIAVPGGQETEYPKALVNNNPRNDFDPSLWLQLDGSLALE